MKVNKNDIAVLTGNAYQDDETFKSEGGFFPERDQLYFEMRQGNNTFLLGLKDILKCIRLLETMKEIPTAGEKWWQTLAGTYGEDILMIDFKESETS